MNTTLKKLKKILIKATTPSREEQIGKALRVIFHGMDEGLTDEEAFKILDWNYKSTDELFEEYDKDRITVNTYKENVVIFNDTVKELPGINGIEVIQFIDELGIEE